MNAEPIRGQANRNLQNVQIQNLQATAAQAVEELIARGFTVLRVVLDGSRPMIWIQHCHQCKELKGGWKIQRVGHGKPERVMAAPFQHCQVQWTERN